MNYYNYFQQYSSIQSGPHCNKYNITSNKASLLVASHWSKGLTVDIIGVYNVRSWL